MVWCTDLYIAKARCQLSDTSSYRPLEYDPIPDCQTIVSQTIHNLITSGDLPPTASNLIVPQPRTACFNVLLKIHESDCAVQERPTYIQDTTHALHLLQDFQFPGPQNLIFTMDIQSLYTCIPHANGLKALHFILSCRPNQSPSTDILIRLMELVLTLNNFSFNSSQFLQTKGVAVRTCMGPSCACPFVGYVEQSLFHCYTGTIPHLFLPYVDDSISAASCSHEELEQLINFANTFHPNLKFTWTISDTSLPFLDHSVSIS
eukprot:g39601.t1